MILSDNDILEEMANGNIICEPFDRPNLSNSSIDLRLGETIFKQASWNPVTFNTDKYGKLKVVGQPKPAIFGSNYILAPNEFVLAETLEYVGSKSPNIIAQVADKSTLARLGLSVCFSTGYIDAGNALNITLELKNNGNMPIQLQSGMHIAQLKFMYLNSECSTIYSGKYIGSIGVETAK